MREAFRVLELAEQSDFPLKEIYSFEVAYLQGVATYREALGRIVGFNGGLEQLANGKTSEIR